MAPCGRLSMCLVWCADGAGRRRKSWIRPPRDDAFAFCSGAASRADGGGARNSPAPPRNAEAFRYKMRRRRIRLFVAARLPAPTGVGPATRLPPGRNAEAFRYKMRRRCIRGFGLCATMPLRFVAARLPAPTGAGPATRLPPGRNAEAFRYKMRRRRCGCGPCAAREFRVSFQRLLVTPPVGTRRRSATKCDGDDAGAARARRASFTFHFSVCLSHPRPERGGVPLQNAARPLLTSDL